MSSRHPVYYWYVSKCHRSWKGDIVRVCLSRLILWSGKSSAEVARASSILGEVVGGNEVGCDARVEANVAVICGSHNRDLESLWISQSQVQLTVLLLVCCRSVWPNSGLEAVEAECDN